MQVIIITQLCLQRGSTWMDSLKSLQWNELNWKADLESKKKKKRKKWKEKRERKRGCIKYLYGAMVLIYYKFTHLYIIHFSIIAQSPIPLFTTNPSINPVVILIIDPSIIHPPIHPPYDISSTSPSKSTFFLPQV